MTHRLYKENARNLLLLRKKGEVEHFRYITAKIGRFPSSSVNHYSSCP